MPRRSRTLRCISSKEVVADGEKGAKRMSKTIDSDGTYASSLVTTTSPRKVNRVVVVLGYRHTNASIATMQIKSVP
jgi:hypothetical protein